MEHCKCGTDKKRKLFTNDCTECEKPIVYEKDFKDIYKFRAECLPDVTRFIAHLWKGCQLVWIRIDAAPDKPDCTVEIKITATDLEEIRTNIARFRDCHVMFESLNTAENYTGERWFTE
jgi:hypothetical protein